MEYTTDKEKSSYDVMNIDAIQKDSKLPREEGMLMPLYSNKEWDLLKTAEAAKAYNLRILRGQEYNPGKGTVQAHKDYEKARGVCDHIRGEKRIGDVEELTERMKDLFSDDLVMRL